VIGTRMAERKHPHSTDPSPKNCSSAAPRLWTIPWLYYVGYTTFPSGEAIRSAEKNFCALISIGAVNRCDNANSGSRYPRRSWMPGCSRSIPVDSRGAVYLPERRAYALTTLKFR